MEERFVVNFALARLDTLKIPLQWKVGYTPQADCMPEYFIPAVVPGAVQLDWATAQNWPAIEYQTEYPVRYDTRNVPIAVDYEWMEDVYWLYRTEINVPPLNRQQLYFVCRGIDYRFQVRLNSQVLCDQEGMFTPVEIDISDIAKPGDSLDVLVFPVPKIYHEPVDEKQSNQSCKPAVSYGWDFHPRLIPLGIWQDAYLEIRPALHLRSAEVFYQLSDYFDRVDLRLDVATSQKSRGNVKWIVRNPAGQIVLDAGSPLGHSRLHLFGTIESPGLWWPNGQGDPVLYTSSVELFDGSGTKLDTFDSRIGFRRVRLIPHAQSWNDPDNAGFPNSCNKPPITLEINGRAIFAKGSNWVGPDIFPGRITTETYQPLVQAAHDANFNMLRCWGGAPVQKEGFFDLCDENGIMVWQEFPLACGNYEGNPAYLRVLDQESRSIITRLRSHASIVIWCGGNELFNNWSRMTDQDPALRLLNRNCFDLDPERPFIMTSPLSGWAHGGYQFRLRNGNEVFDYFPKAHNTAYTEFGVPGIANEKLLERIIPVKELFPPHPGTSWQARHAFHAWDGSPDSWLELWCVEHYFDEPSSLGQLVQWSQWLQCEGLKCVFEEARRQKPVCSMALNWCFNEPWPSAANNSLLSWPAEPKPALQAVRAALRPVLASARIPKFSWKAGETFTADLYLLNDSPESVAKGKIDAIMRIANKETHLFNWNHPETAANINLCGPTLRCSLPDLPSGQFELILRVKDHPEWNSKYMLRMCEK
jgi:beta-mannosidase